MNNSKSIYSKLDFIDSAIPVSVAVTIVSSVTSLSAFAFIKLSNQFAGFFSNKALLEIMLQVAEIARFYMFLWGMINLAVLVGLVVYKTYLSNRLEKIISGLEETMRQTEQPKLF